MLPCGARRPIESGRGQSQRCGCLNRWRLWEWQCYWPSISGTSTNEQKKINDDIVTKGAISWCWHSKVCYSSNRRESWQANITKTSQVRKAIGPLWRQSWLFSKRWRLTSNDHKFSWRHAITSSRRWCHIQMRWRLWNWEWLPKSDQVLLCFKWWWTINVKQLYRIRHEFRKYNIIY